MEQRPLHFVKWNPFYSIALIGGSLVKHGGHNPIEAIKLGCVALSGPYIHNFRNLYDSLEQKNTVIKTNDLFNLEIAINKLLTDKKYYSQIQNNGAKYCKEHQGILDKTYKFITESLINQNSY